MMDIPRRRRDFKKRKEVQESQIKWMIIRGDLIPVGVAILACMVIYYSFEGLI